MRVELDRRRCFAPDSCEDCLRCVEAWDRFEKGGDDGAILRGIDGFASARVGRAVPEDEERAALEAARVCPTGAIAIRADRYEP